MLDPNEAANQTEAAAVDQVAQDVQEVATPETTEQVTPEQSGQQTVQNEAVDEFGVPWRERAAEYQRKLTETTERLPQIVEETLARQQQKQQATQVKTYSIQELEQIALQSPELRPQVEEEKEKIRQNQFLRIIEERDQKIATVERNKSIVRESEMSVKNDPNYKDCFNTDAMGNKIWNTAHPMTQLIGQYLQDPRLNGQPDAIVIASKLARIDYLDKVASKATTQAKVLQANLKREQKKTMVEGGNTVSRGSVDDYSKAKEELSRTGSAKAAQSAVSAYLKKAGHLR
jgi:hypothetical protein